MVADPVEGRGREDRVDRLFEPQLEQVLRERLDIVAEAFLCLLDHRAAAVDRDHRAVREPLEQLRGHAAGAAAGVEHALVAAQVQAVDDVARHRELGVRLPVVRGGVPFARWHTTVRYRIRRILRGPPSLVRLYVAERHVRTRSGTPGYCVGTAPGVTAGVGVGFGPLAQSLVL